MSKKSLKLGVALAAGAGAAAVLAKNSKCNPVTSKAPSKSASSKNSVNSDYRNTERGKYEKNSKGIYYTNGNYEAFVCKVYNFTYLYTHLRLKFITGNRRTTAYIRHCDIDTEIVQRIL